MHLVGWGEEETKKGNIFWRLRFTEGKLTRRQLIKAWDSLKHVAVEVWRNGELTRCFRILDTQVVRLIGYNLGRSMKLKPVINL
jgi:hypothetical protein